MEIISGRRAPASILNLALTDQDSLALIFQLRERTFRKGDLRSMASDQADSPQRTRARDGEDAREGDEGVEEDRRLLTCAWTVNQDFVGIQTSKYKQIQYLDI